MNGGAVRSMEVIKFLLEPGEHKALEELAERELRSAPNQVRAIVRDRLQQEGLLEKIVAGLGLADENARLKQQLAEKNAALGALAVALKPIFGLLRRPMLAIMAGEIQGNAEEYRKAAEDVSLALAPDAVQKAVEAWKAKDAEIEQAHAIQGALLADIQQSNRLQHEAEANLAEKNAALQTGRDVIRWLREGTCPHITGEAYQTDAWFCDVCAGKLQQCLLGDTVQEEKP